MAKTSDKKKSKTFSVTLEYFQPIADYIAKDATAKSDLRKFVEQSYEKEGQPRKVQMGEIDRWLNKDPSKRTELRFGIGIYILRWWKGTKN